MFSKQEKSDYIFYLLLRDKVITEEQAKRAKQLVSDSNFEFDILAALKKLKFVDDAKIRSVLAIENGMNTIDDLLSRKIEPEAIKQINVNIAKEYNIFPISFDGVTLTVAISDPIYFEPLETLKFILKRHIEGVVAPAEQISKMIENYYISLDQNVKSGTTITDIIISEIQKFKQKKHIDSSSAVFKIDFGILGKLYAAQKNHKTVRIEYLSSKEATTKRDVDPYYISPFNNFWYLQGRCDRQKSLRVFRLDRIQSIELTEKSFSIPRSFINALLNIYPFVFNEIKDIQFRCSNTIAPHVIKMAHGCEYKTDKSDSSQIIITLESAPLISIGIWILSQADNVEVISPPKLKTFIKDISDKLHNRHKA